MLPWPKILNALSFCTGLSNSFFWRKPGTENSIYNVSVCEVGNASGALLILSLSF